jgi:hypothetical protein
VRFFFTLVGQENNVLGLYTQAYVLCFLTFCAMRRKSFLQELRCISKCGYNINLFKFDKNINRVYNTRWRCEKHMNTKTTLLFAIIFFSFLTFGWAQTPAETSLQQKLDEVNGKTATTKKEKKNKNAKTTTPTTAPAGETERERLVRLRALVIEASENLKKAENEARRAQSPAMKQAEKQITRQANDQAKAERQATEVIRDAQITGCKAALLTPQTGTNLDQVLSAVSLPDSGIVTWEMKSVLDTALVSPEAEPWHWVRRIYQSSVVRVINTGALTIDEISGPKGVLVRNLRSGCAMTMTFYQDFLDSDNVPISLMAIARPKDGGVATAPFQVYLNRNDNYTRVQSQTWQVNLQRQFQTR